MDLRQLEHFLAVAEEQHFTRAARRVNIVQSGLSASIRALEEELGAPLFIRSTRRVDLTAAGRVLAEEARRVLAAAQGARDAVAAVQGLAPGAVIPLGRDPGEAVDIVANGRRVGRGEIVRIEGELGVRVVRLFGDE